MRRLLRLRAPALALATAVALLTATEGAAADDLAGKDRFRVLTTGLGLTVGSTVGPDGALYVTDASAGTLVRVDPRTGRSRVVADGLPVQGAPGLGGPIDVEFLGRTAYVLVTLVGPDVGGSDVNGIYRVDRHRVTPVADIGAYATANPPSTEFFVPSGLQYALVGYRDGFLVTDGHHNRVYRVTTRGEVSVAAAFDNTVPTGIAARGRAVWMTEAGPVPHLPETGRVTRLDLAAGQAVPIASGARLAVDVGVDRGRLYVLSQGELPPGAEPGAPATPDTGALYRVADDGTMQLVTAGLDRPTSVQVINGTAYVVTMDGEIDTVPVGRHGPWGPRSLTPDGDMATQVTTDVAADAPRQATLAARGHRPCWPCTRPV